MRIDRFGLLLSSCSIYILTESSGIGEFFTAWFQWFSLHLGVNNRQYLHTQTHTRHTLDSQLDI